MKKKLAAMLLTASMATTMLTGCTLPEELSWLVPSGGGGGSTQQIEEESAEESIPDAVPGSDASEASGAEEVSSGPPKYIFLFIGDGMGYTDIQMTNYYLNAISDSSALTVEVNGEVKAELSMENKLNMLSLTTNGTAQTYNSTSMTPDSASAGSAMACGKKIWSSGLNVSNDGTETYETIAEKLKNQLGYKIGIISTANLNHATPAAFYAHQANRGSYYEIGKELIASNFDYFAGGEMRNTTGDGETQEPDLYVLAAEAGYTLINTYADAATLNSGSGKVIITSEVLADSQSLSYEIDRGDEWALSNYVDKGIECLYNETGFFMMVEGGKIDWALHANDAGTAIKDTIALDQAVGSALNFYNQHPDETLVIVTGDHETGGLSLGSAAANYNTYLENFQFQRTSFAKFNSEHVPFYKANGITFDVVMNDITRLFGLMAPADVTLEVTTDADSDDLHSFVETTEVLRLTAYEYQQLQEAYNVTMTRTGGETSFGEEEYEDYGSYEPLTVTITHLLANKSGVDFSSYAHTSDPVAVLAGGVGEDLFDGYYDNTDIYNKLAELTGVQ